MVFELVHGFFQETFDLPLPLLPGASESFLKGIPLGISPSLLIEERSLDHQVTFIVQESVILFSVREHALYRPSMLTSNSFRQALVEASHQFLLLLFRFHGLWRNKVDPSVSISTGLAPSLANHSIIL